MAERKTETIRRKLDLYMIIRALRESAEHDSFEAGRIAATFGITRTADTLIAQVKEKDALANDMEEADALFLETYDVSTGEDE